MFDKPIVSLRLSGLFLLLLLVFDWILFAFFINVV